MQLFNKNEGTFTPDALIVSPDFTILTGGIGSIETWNRNREGN